MILSGTATLSWGSWMPGRVTRSSQWLMHSWNWSRHAFNVGVNMPLEIKACAGSHCATAIFAMYNSCYWSKMFKEVQSAETIPLKSSDISRHIDTYSLQKLKLHLWKVSGSDFLSTLQKQRASQWAKCGSAVSKLYLAVSHKIGHEVTDGRWVPSGELERLAALLVERCWNEETNDSKRLPFDRLLGKSLEGKNVETICKIQRQISRFSMEKHRFTKIFAFHHYSPLAEMQRFTQ